MFILILLCLVVYLFVYAYVYFLYINISFVIFLFIFTFIIIYIYNLYKLYFYTKKVKKNVSHKSTKFGMGLKNCCMLNDFKEDDKIDFDR